MPRSAWILCLAAMTASASAQSVQAQADALFREGKQLMAKQQFAEACTRFARSHDLEPDVATLLNHADCREKNAQLATAWRLFTEAERQTKASATLTQLHATAATRAGKLQARLSTLSIDVAPDHRRDGLEILRDADRVDPGAWGQAVPIDGGTYKITARAPGRAEWSTTVVVKPEGDVQAVAIPALAPLDPVPPVEPKPDVRPPAPAAGPPLAVTPPGATAAPAGPPAEPLPAPAPEGEPKSPNVALALSLGGTLVSYGLALGAGLLASSQDEVPGEPSDPPAAATVGAAAGLIGVVLAPSFGHWYAGKLFTRGLGMRLGGPPIAAVGVLVTVVGAFSDSDGGTALAVLGVLTTIGGAGLFAFGTIEDIATAPRRVRNQNRARGFAIMPMATPSSAGLALGGRF